MVETSMVQRRLARRAAPLVPDSPASGAASSEEHLAHSVNTAVHALLVEEVDFGAVDVVRKQAGLTYLPFVARAVVGALREHPDVNASVVGGSLQHHAAVNLGVAVDLAFEGLVVPVVHDAGDLRLRALARSIADLADRARRRALQPHDVEGGTFTLTNVGSRATLSSAPIINHPQVGILSMGGIRPRPIARADGDGWAIAVRPIGHLSFSFDHRAFDGAYAASFLEAVRTQLEDHDWATELA